MAKHAKERSYYPLRVYKHWALNQWNYFQKPKLVKKVVKLKTSIINLWSNNVSRILRRPSRTTKN